MQDSVRSRSSKPPLKDQVEKTSSLSSSLVFPKKQNAALVSNASAH
jgi:hypothetical protein